MSLERFWDEHWANRIQGDGSVVMNEAKARKLIKELWMKPHFIPLRKLEIGCGPGVHISVLAHHCPGWKENYLGIDMSSVAVEQAKRNGLNALHGNFMDLEPMSKHDHIDFFLLIDVLEHVEDHAGLAGKIKQLGNSFGYVIFGNIPLYRSPHEKNGGYEREMNIEVLTKFLNHAGVPSFKHTIYGLLGWPYMMFEGSSHAA